MNRLSLAIVFVCCTLGHGFSYCLNTACGQGNFENTDVQGFAELVADTNVVVLDVRTAAEFAEGHLERAINIDYHQSDFVE